MEWPHCDRPTGNNDIIWAHVDCHVASHDVTTNGVTTAIGI
jgi:hypothetical protein